MAAMRRCIGSAKFGIEGHEAPVDDFPVQPSQKDGLGRMCKTHWNQYTSALRKAALERKAVDAGGTGTGPAPAPTKRGRAAKTVPAAEAAPKPGRAAKADRPSRDQAIRDLESGATAPGDWTGEPAKPERKRPAAAPKAESAKARKARAVVAATESLGGKAYTDAIGSDEVQAALAGIEGDVADREVADVEEARVA